MLSQFSRYSCFKISDLENVGQGHDVQHLQWYQLIATSYLMEIIIFSLSLTNYEIFVNKKTPKPLPWKARSRSRSSKAGLVPFTRNVGIHIGDFFFRMLAAWEHTFHQIGCTQQETGVMTSGK